MIKKVIVLCLLLLYGFSLSFYTSYGIFKSYNEYFCRQRRPDNQDYYTELSSDYMNFSHISGQIGVKFVSYMDGEMLGFGGTNDELLLTLENQTIRYNVNSNMTKRYGPKLEVDYHTKYNYFKLTCGPDVQTDWNITRRKEQGLEKHVVYDRSLEFDEEGYPKITTSSLFAMSLNKTISEVFSVKCKVSKSPYTCSTKQSTSDLFYKTYVYVASLLTLIIFCGLLNINDYAILRFLIVLQRKVSALAELNFCNPITGLPVYLKTGSFIYKLTVNQTLNNEECEDWKELSELRDRRGVYIIKNNSVIVKINGKVGHVLHLETEQIQQLKKYFYEITIDEKNCVVNQEETHYLETEEVITKLSMGMYLKKAKKTKSGFILDVDILSFEYFKSTFSISDYLCKYLIKHNMLFFNGVNIAALENCLSGKMQFYRRPKDVNNSQWKWYSSDFCLIMKEKQGSNCRSQVKWRPSKAFIKVAELDESEFAVVNKTFEFEIKSFSYHKEIAEVFYRSCKRDWDNVVKGLPITQVQSKVKNDRSGEDELGNDHYLACYNRMKDKVMSYCDALKSEKITEKLMETKKIDEMVEIWNKSSAPIIDLQKTINKKLHFAKKCINKPKIITVPRKLTKSEGKRIMEGYNVDRREIKVKHKAAENFEKLGKAFVDSQKELKAFLVVVQNRFEVLKDLEVEIEDYLGKESKEGNFKKIFSTKEIVNSIFNEKKTLKTKKKSTKTKNKNKNNKLPRLKHFTRLKKYFSADFKEACDCACKLSKKENFTSNIRCKAVLELKRLLRKKMDLSGMTRILRNDEKLLDKWEKMPYMLNSISKSIDLVSKLDKSNEEFFSILDIEK